MGDKRINEEIDLEKIEENIEEIFSTIRNEIRDENTKFYLRSRFFSKLKSEFVSKYEKKIKENYFDNYFTNRLNELKGKISIGISNAFEEYKLKIKNKEKSVCQNEEKYKHEKTSLANIFQENYSKENFYKIKDIIENELKQKNKEIYKYDKLKIILTLSTKFLFRAIFRLRFSQIQVEIMKIIKNHIETLSNDLLNELHKYVDNYANSIKSNLAELFFNENKEAHSEIYDFIEENKSQIMVMKNKFAKFI